MKKQVRFVQRIAVVAFAFVSTAAFAQTGENPKPNNRPRGGTQTNTPPPPPPPPVPPQQNNPRPVMIPPVLIPGGVMNQPGMPQGNMQTGPVKTPEQIARENKDAAKNQILREISVLNADIQTFEINDITKPFQVKGAKGFIVHFPEFAFVDEEGNTVLGEVQIKLTEYTSLSEFAAAGLSTMTTDGDILETGGMINIDAKSGDKNIKLAKGKEISITVPNADPNKGFQTFYGSGIEQVKWSTNPNQSNADTDTMPFEGYTIKMLKPNGHAHGDNFTMAFYKNDESLESYVNSQLKVSKDVQKKILKSGIPFVYTIEFNALGKIKSVAPKNRELTDKSIISPLNSQIISILKNAPAFAMTEGNLMAGKPYDLIFATVKNYTGKQVVIAPPLSFPANKNNNAVNENPSENNVNEFTMKSSSLQKINCDRFSGYNAKDTSFFHFDRADALVYIVVRDMRAMISPSGANGDYMMTKIPPGTPVRYVAVIYDDMGNVSISAKEALFKQENVTFDTRLPFSSFNLKAALEAP